MRPTLPYQPALDGVRALAVVAVLLFHAGIRGFSGGYLGVSVFFTLSGYLITGLIVHERASTGRVDLGGFYARRLRRLLPASVTCLAAIAAARALTDWFDGVEHLRRDLLGAVFQVANWVALAGGGSYRDLLAADAGVASPVEHFWSLAIEEQFYWVWPPVLAWWWARAAAPRRRLQVVTAVTAAAVVVAPVVAAVWGADAAYWATPARLAEILVGAWLAVVLHTRRAVPGRRWGWLAPLALSALVVAVVTFPPDRGPAYRGALPLVAVVSAVLLAGLQVDGPVRRLLSTPPLVWAGRVSYGLYVYHWPIYLVLDEARTGLGGPALLVVRLGVTLVVAAASFHFVEQPIRHARRVRRRRTYGWSLAAASASVAVTLALVPGPLGEYWRIDAATAASAAIDPADATPPTAHPTTTMAPPPTAPRVYGPSWTPAAPPVTAPSSAPSRPPTGPEPTRPVRILVVGDSTAQALGGGLVTWAAADPDAAQVTSLAGPACGLITGARVHGEFGRLVPVCDEIVTQRVPAAIAELRPDVVVVMVTVGDVLTRSWDGGTTWLTAADDEYRERLAAAYTATLAAWDAPAEAAPRVVWVRPPVARPGWEADHPSFTDGTQAYVDDVVRATGVDVVDLRAWMEDSGLAADRAARPDGVHLAPEAATAVAAWLGPELAALAGNR